MTDKLLVIEDSRPIAMVIKKIAQTLNFDVSVCRTLAETETMLQSGTKFFAATIDYALPDANDGEAITCVLSHGIPSLVMTGKMDENTRKKILALPVIDYIPKENGQAFLYLKRILQAQRTNSNIGILVVDDSSSARNHIVELLKRRNFNVYVAEHGVKALEIMQQYQNIKMVITDLEMPIMGGIELTNELRKTYSRDNLAIIGISGANNGIHSARFIKNGADDFLRKPFCHEEFYCRITQNIENINNIEQLKYTADTDYLTELPNRRAFFREGETHLQYYLDNNHSYCLAMIDIDHFKKTNDTYGHDAGDHVLKVLALYMRKNFSNGLLSRLGGEEFSVILSGEDEDQLHVKLDDFRRNIAVSNLTYGDNQLVINVSIGAIFNSKKSLSEQLHLADKALYFAKENGRNQVCVSGEEHD
jgi:diguanylate cyclase (GGDEF)-like protein